MTTVRDSWTWSGSEARVAASIQRKLNQLAARAEKENDATTLAFVALRTDDAGRYAALADRAVSLNQDLVWIYVPTILPLRPPPQPQRLERLRASDPDNAVPVLLAADTVAQRTKDLKKPSTFEDEEALLASDPNWMALMGRAFTAPRYDAYLERNYQLVGSVWKREPYLPPSVVMQGLWTSPTLLNLRIFSNIRAREAEKAAAAGDWNKAERLLGEVDSLGERIVAANSTMIEKLIAIAISRIANQERVKLYTSAGRASDVQKAKARLQQMDATVATLRQGRNGYGRMQTYVRWGILLHVAAGLALTSGLVSLAAILFLELLPARIANQKTLWRKTLCRAADYAPATFLVASGTLLLSFLPFTHAFSECFTQSNGVSNEKLISDVFSGLMAVPGFVSDVPLAIWFSGAASLAALAVFIVRRSIYRSRRIQAVQT